MGALYHFLFEVIKGPDGEAHEEEEPEDIDSPRSLSSNSRTLLHWLKMIEDNKDEEQRKRSAKAQRSSSEEPSSDNSQKQEPKAKGREERALKKLTYRQCKYVEACLLDLKQLNRCAHMLSLLKQVWICFLFMNCKSTTKRQ